MPIQIAVGLALGAVIFYPAMRICRRAGLRWPISLVVFVPLIGPLILLALLAFIIWPSDPYGKR